MKKKPIYQMYFGGETYIRITRMPREHINRVSLEQTIRGFLNLTILWPNCTNRK